MMVKGGIGLADLAGYDLGFRDCSYEERDAILYALAVGAVATDLDLICEKQLHVLPTFSLTMGLWAVEAAGSLGAYDRFKTLHVGQQLKIREPLPPSGSIGSRAVVKSVWDKGSVTLVDVLVTSSYFDAVYTIFVPESGGLDTKGSPPIPPPIPNRSADVEKLVVTHENQAALYRLTGDSHPVHIDPVAAKTAGFPRPILHGLCTLGAVSLAIAEAADVKPWQLSELGARFAAPVLPGASINVSYWSENSQSMFVASVDGTEVLKFGVASFAS